MLGALSVGSVLPLPALRAPSRCPRLGRSARAWLLPGLSVCCALRAPRARAPACVRRAFLLCSPRAPRVLTRADARPSCSLPPAARAGRARRLRFARCSSSAAHRNAPTLSFTACSASASAGSTGATRWALRRPPLPASAAVSRAPAARFLFLRGCAEPGDVAGTRRGHGRFQLRARELPTHRAAAAPPVPALSFALCTGRSCSTSASPSST